MSKTGVCLETEVCYLLFGDFARKIIKKIENKLGHETGWERLGIIDIYLNKECRMRRIDSNIDTNVELTIKKGQKRSRRRLEVTTGIDEEIFWDVYYSIKNNSKYRYDDVIIIDKVVRKKEEPMSKCIVAISKIEEIDNSEYTLKYPDIYTIEIEGQFWVWAIKELGLQELEFCNLTHYEIAEWCIKNRGMGGYYKCLK